MAFLDSSLGGHHAFNVLRIPSPIRHCDLIWILRLHLSSMYKIESVEQVFTFLRGLSHGAMDLSALALPIAILPYLYRFRNDHHRTSEDISLSSLWTAWNLRKQLKDILLESLRFLFAYPLGSSIITLSLSVLLYICLLYSSITLWIAAGQRSS